MDSQQVYDIWRDNFRQILIHLRTADPVASVDFEREVRRERKARKLANKRTRHQVGEVAWRGFREARDRSSWDAEIERFRRRQSSRHANAARRQHSGAA